MHGQFRRAAWGLLSALSLCVPALGAPVRVAIPKASLSSIPGAPAAASILGPSFGPLTSLAPLAAPALNVSATLSPIMTPAPMTVQAPEAKPIATVLEAVASLAPKQNDPAQTQEESQKSWQKALNEAAPEQAVAAEPVEAPGASWSRLSAERNSPAAQTRWNSLLSEARASTGKAVPGILAAKSKGVKTKAILAAKDTKTITEYSGVPGRVEEVQDHQKVFRHWVRNEADLRSILSAGLLRAGPVSYVEFTGSSRAYIKDIYPDLRGVFFTAPKNLSSEPRVMNEATPHYIDFRIPEGVRALSLDGETVMMVPAEPGAFIPVEVTGSSLDPAS